MALAPSGLLGRGASPRLSGRIYSRLLRGLCVPPAALRSGSSTMSNGMAREARLPTPLPMSLWTTSVIPSKRALGRTRKMPGPSLLSRLPLAAANLGALQYHLLALRMQPVHRDLQSKTPRQFMNWGHQHKQHVLTDDDLDRANLVYIHSLYFGEPAYAAKMAVFGCFHVMNSVCKTVLALHLYERALLGAGAAGPEPQRYLIECRCFLALQDDEGAAHSHPVRCQCALCLWRFGPRSRRDSVPLAILPITIAVYDAVFAPAVAELNIMNFLFTPHCCRHEGAPYDFALQA